MSEIGKRDHDFERAVEGMDEMTVLSMYYAQRNRSESAEQRAQRAEAECERLRADNEFLRKRRGQLVIERDQARGDLPEVAPSPDSEPAFLDGDFTLSLRELQHGLNCLSVDNAMDRPDFQLAWDIYEAAKQCATPAPEGEPKTPYRKKAMDSDAVLERAARQAHESLRHVHRALGADAPHTPEQGESELEQRNQAIRARYGLAPPVYPEGPEQAHGDALALFEWYSQKCWFMTSVERKDLEDRIRQALAASGVPYVPEEVRRLPDKWDAEVDGPEVESHWRDAVGGCIDDLKDALASAPAVPVSKYGEHSADVVADSNWSAGARFGWNCAIAGDKNRLEQAIQSRIDERAQIAAAPMDGRE